MTSVDELLDRLADAFASHGLDVRSNLLPGATAADLDAVEASLGVVLPPAYRDLYTWSAGCTDPDADPALTFRDNRFLPLDRVVKCRRQVAETYRDIDGIDLTTAAPFAEFMGSV